MPVNRGIAFLFAFFTLISVCTIYGDNIDRRYEKAAKNYHRLFKSTQYNKIEDNWLKTIRQFQTIFKNYPKHRQAAPSLYNIGKLYRGLFQRSRKSIYLDRSNIAFRTVVKKYPTSELADNAQYLLAENYEIYQKEHNLAYYEYQKLITLFPNQSMAKKAAVKLTQLNPNLKSVPTPTQPDNVLPPNDLATARFGGLSEEEANQSDKLILISKIDCWSTDDWSRMVINIGEDVRYKYQALPEDKSRGKSKRMVVDIINAYLPLNFNKKIATDDGLVKQIRVAQFDQSTVRIVLDLTNLKKVKVFDFKLPRQYKIVVDVLGQSPVKNHIASKSIVAPTVEIKEDKQQPLTLANNLGLTVKRIILDPGHGGKDPGAVAFGIKEKDIALKIAKQLKQVINREKPRMEVLLTRNKDIFLSLEARTAFANKNQGDLFISIHLNASDKEQVWGLETYSLDLATDNDALALAAKENQTTVENMSGLQRILNELMVDSKIKESELLAKYIQKSAIDAIRATKIIHLKDLGIKQAPFRVLLGARMPSALIEVGFLTNKQEHKLLKTGKYHLALATGIFKGISGYIN